MAPSEPTAAVAAATDVLLPPATAEAIRERLVRLADDVVDAITAEVPSYEDALGGRMGTTIRQAVQLALGGFLSLASGRRGAEPRTPTAPAVDGAYQLGRGEARAGRTTEALLSAYRIGARVSWRQMSEVAVAGGLPADTMASFAELVFAYIDELSASSVAGHTDELASTGRVRQRRLERLARHLVEGASAETLTADAEEADWSAPTTLTALVVPQAQVRPTLAGLSAATLQLLDVPGLEAASAAARPRGARAPPRDAAAPARGPRRGGRARPALAGRAALGGAGPARPRGGAGRRHRGAPGLAGAHRRPRGAGRPARPGARADGRPEAGRGGEAGGHTLRAWLLHQGRREEVAAALFVHPQTVRYRMGQLRELFGDDLDDPGTVLRLVLALGAHP